MYSKDPNGEISNTSDSQEETRRLSQNGRQAALKSKSPTLFLSVKFTFPELLGLGSSPAVPALRGGWTQHWTSNRVSLSFRSVTRVE